MRLFSCFFSFSTCQKKLQFLLLSWPSYSWLVVSSVRKRVSRGSRSVDLLVRRSVVWMVLRSVDPYVVPSLMSNRVACVGLIYFATFNQSWKTREVDSSEIKTCYDKSATLYSYASALLQTIICHSPTAIWIVTDATRYWRNVFFFLNELLCN